MSDLVLSVDQKKLDELTGYLDYVKNGVKKLVASALNKTAMTGRSRVTKELASILTLKQKHIREVLTVKKANFDKLSASIVISKKPIPLYEFSPIPRLPAYEQFSSDLRKGKKPPKKERKGVSVKVRKTEPRKVLAHTFIARMKSGYVGIFEREGRGNQRSKKRLPIEERFGPTPLGVFENAPGVSKRVMADLNDVLFKNLVSQVNRVLAKQNAE